jgi:hypothetical protein
MAFHKQGFTMAWSLHKLEFIIVTQNYNLLETNVTENPIISDASLQCRIARIAPLIFLLDPRPLTYRHGEGRTDWHGFHIKLLSFYLLRNAQTCKKISVFHLHSNMQKFFVIGPSILVYIRVENQQMHQNDHFIVMSSQTLLHVSAYQRHHQGAHMILTSCLYVGVHYRKNNGIWSEAAPISIVTLWI